jgi:hypothetical protein
MNIAQDKRNERLTPEYEAAASAMYEKIAKGEYQVDCSDIPETDEFNYKYSVPLGQLLAMDEQQRREVRQRMIAAKEADRAAKKAQEEFNQAIAKTQQLARQT